LSTKKAEASVQEINRAIIEGIRDVKGKKIVSLDLRNLPDASVNFFIICQGDSTTQVNAISDSIQKHVKETCFVTPMSTVGTPQGRWVCMDYLDTVVHVFYPEVRAFYDLETLWYDARRTDFEDVE